MLKYLIPAITFQSIVIAGGYGTGRELVEFFMTVGPLSGLLAMGVTAVIWMLVAALSFDMARRTRSYNYKDFFHNLLGRGWILFELVYIVIIVLVAAVVAASCAELMANLFGLPFVAGTAVFGLWMIGSVGAGAEWLKKAFSFWSTLLYATYALVFAFALSQLFASELPFSSETAASEEWLVAGLKYAGYNVASLPAVFFTLTLLENRRECYIAGILCGLVTITPAVLLFTSLLVLYPEVLSETVPSLALLAKIDTPWLTFLFQIVLLGTLIETGAGLVHSFNDRLAVTIELTKKGRFTVALVFVVIGVAVSQFGLIDLIAEGYGTITWVVILLFVLPVLASPFIKRTDIE
ncbi:MAG: hypothetical protein AB2598_08905 [Candidatus Thiodiazotropha sp.]